MTTILFLKTIKSALENVVCKLMEQMRDCNEIFDIPPM